MNVNWLAVLVAAVVSFIVGGIWYSPAVFGKQFMTLAGLKKDDRKGSRPEPGLLLGAFIVALITSSVLDKVIIWTQSGTVLQGAKIGFWMWLGFIATTRAGEYLFTGRPTGLYLVTSGHNLVALLITGALLAAWH
ncbi:MAG TPA: DUF1761 domain-containing protein [bacterium]|nr:DUF1761 domain-containing protein [bacterium]